MKFRGTIVENLALKEFHNIALTLSKLSKSCVLRITPSNMYFIMTNDDTCSTPVVWCDLNNNYFFKDYVMDGLSAQNNEIYLEFLPQLLIKALVFLKNTVKSLKIKLTNKSTPCLTIEIECPEGNQNQQCMHDIPVVIIPQRMWCEFSEPENLTYDITIAMPPLRTVKSITERFKSLGQHLTISATRNGRFGMSIFTTRADLAAHVPDLRVEKRDDDATQMDDDEEINAKIDIKKFHSYVSNLHITSTHLSCGIIMNNLIRIFVENDFVNAQFFLTSSE